MASNLTEQEQILNLSLYGTTDPIVVDLARRIAVLESIVLTENSDHE